MTCGLGGYAADARMGLDGRFSSAVRRVICLAGAMVSFAATARWIEASCGWRVSDEAVRRLCQREAGSIAAWREAASHPEAPTWAEAEGAVEFQGDAAKVNTTGGWRDVELGVLAIRPEADPAAPEQWDTREVPAPAIRLSFAAIEDCHGFGRRWWPWMERLGLAGRGPIVVLGDGAEWIWDQAASQFPERFELLDIYRASEHLADAARELSGADDPRVGPLLESGRSALLSGGWSGLCAWIAEVLGEAPEAARQAAMDKLATYFSKHLSRLDYAGWLAAGRPIGSGLVEGSAKQIIVKRLKQTSARWRVENVNRMAVLTSLAASMDWDGYWTRAA